MTYPYQGWINPPAGPVQAPEQVRLEPGREGGLSYRLHLPAGTQSLTASQAATLRDLLCEQLGVPDAAAKLCSAAVDSSAEASDKLTEMRPRAELAYSWLVRGDARQAQFLLARAIGTDIAARLRVDAAELGQLWYCDSDHADGPRHAEAVAHALKSWRQLTLLGTMVPMLRELSGYQAALRELREVIGEETATREADKLQAAVLEVGL